MRFKFWLIFFAHYSIWICPFWVGVYGSGLVHGNAKNLDFVLFLYFNQTHHISLDPWGSCLNLRRQFDDYRRDCDTHQDTVPAGLEVEETLDRSPPHTRAVTTALAPLPCRPTARSKTYKWKPLDPDQVYSGILLTPHKKVKKIVLNSKNCKNCIGHSVHH